jgi:F1F0 ATPase subunit 2
LHLTIAFGAGIILGAFYFYGLWLTVRRLPSARRPVVMSLSSFFGRLAVVLVGFYFVTADHWERLVVCLVGFLAARLVLVKIFGPQGKSARSDSGIIGGPGTDSGEEGQEHKGHHSVHLKA